MWLYEKLPGFQDRNLIVISIVALIIAVTCSLILSREQKKINLEDFEPDYKNPGFSLFAGSFGLGLQISTSGKKIILKKFWRELFF